MSVAAVNGIVYSYRKLRGISGKNVTIMHLPNFREEKALYILLLA